MYLGSSAPDVDMRAIALASLYALSVSASSWVVPGAVWYDSAGAKIDAHGGMIIKPGDIFYWVRAARRTLSSRGLNRSS